MDRRSFIRGGAIAASTAALTLGTGSLMGCSPNAGDGDASVNENETSPDIPKGLTFEIIERSSVELDPITEFTKEETYDIVVVGAGCSGIPAVLTALEEGATVGVLQKESDAAANGNGCSAVILNNSTKAGIEHWISDWAKENKWRLNRELFQYYIDHSEETQSWIVQQSMSVDFPPVNCTTKATIIYPDGSVVATAEAASKSNDELMKLLAKKAQDEGAVFHFSTPAVQIIVDDSGAVSGVIGKDEAGNYIKMNAMKAVIMAAGDYQNNDAFVKQYCPDPFDLWRKQANRTGDGHILASMAGGRIVPANHAKQCHDLQSSGSTFMATPLLALDPKGERFYNEECIMTSWNVVMKYHFHDEQPLIYRFFDSEYETKYKGVGQVPPLETLEANLTENSDNPLRRMFKADTIAGLCEQLDLDADVFQQSIDRYNELCASGFDDDFGKAAEYMQAIDTPPYYCIETKPGLSAINGGVHVDGNYQVIDADRKPISGLFAVGVNGGDLCGGIDWAMPGGSSNCHCFNAGRYAAIYAITGGLTPTNLCSFEDIASNFADDSGKFNWDKPDVARHDIEIW